MPPDGASRQCGSLITTSKGPLQLRGLELQVKAGEDEEFHPSLLAAGDSRSMTRLGSNALFSALPLQFT